MRRRSVIGNKQGVLIIFSPLTEILLCFILPSSAFDKRVITYQ